MRNNAEVKHGLAKQWLGTVKRSIVSIAWIKHISAWIAQIRLARQRFRKAERSNANAL